MPATTADATGAVFFNAGGGATGLAMAPEEMAKVGRKGAGHGVTRQRGRVLAAPNGDKPVTARRGEQESSEDLTWRG